MFGEVVDGVMKLNDAGQVVAETWVWLGARYDHVRVDEWCVLPNHLHGVVTIVESDVGTGCRGGSRTAPTAKGRKPLGRLIGAFKTVSTRRINILHNSPGNTVWQRNYYERIIRDDNELARTRQYMRINPVVWAEDPENPFHN